MNPAEYERMYSLEDWYWWFVARRAAALRFLQDHAPQERPLRVLDAGCGTGGMLSQLRSLPGIEPLGVDRSPAALGFTRGRGHSRLVGADLTLLPFRSGRFDAVVALDVIEHVADDERAVAEIARVLRPGGLLVASVPAYNFLWSAHDEALHHRRRYTAGEFRALLGRAGLPVERDTYLLTALFPVAALVRLFSRRKRPGGGALLPRVTPALNRALIGLQAAELEIARRTPLPFGLSVLAVGRKPAPARVRLPAREEGCTVPVARG